MTVVSRADAELVARCRAGDVDAFEALYRQHAARLYSLACRMTGSAAEAEDLLQTIEDTLRQRILGDAVRLEILASGDARFARQAPRTRRSGPTGG